MRKVCVFGALARRLTAEVGYQSVLDSRCLGIQTNAQVRTENRFGTRLWAPRVLTADVCFWHGRSVCIDWYGIGNQQQ